MFGCMGGVGKCVGASGVGPAAYSVAKRMGVVGHNANAERERRVAAMRADHERAVAERAAAAPVASGTVSNANKERQTKQANALRNKAAAEASAAATAKKERANATASADYYEDVAEGRLPNPFGTYVHDPTQPVLYQPPSGPKGSNKNAKAAAPPAARKRSTRRRRASSRTMRTRKIETRRARKSRGTR